MKKYIGCDLGGTNLRAGVVDPTNEKFWQIARHPHWRAKGTMR